MGNPEKVPNGSQLQSVYKPSGEKAVLEKPKGWGVRHMQAVLLFFCLTVTYALRVNLSVAIVAMVEEKGNHTDNSTLTESNSKYPTYDWDESRKSVVLSSFFWGYVITQVPGGQLAKHYGAKITLLISMILCSLVNLLLPIFAKYGDWPAIVAVRMVSGFCQGVIFPSTHTLLARWSPPCERGRFGTYTYAGCQFGTVAMLAVSGYLASTMGWPSIFYFSGAAGLVWSIIWFFYGGSSPSDYKKISPEEKEFIESSLQTGEHTRTIETPWKAMLTSPPMIALILVHCSHNWGFWTLLTEMPSYMKGVLGFNIKENALLSALPYFVMMILSFILSPIADCMTNKKVTSVVTSRKLFNSIGLWGPMLALIGLAVLVQPGDQILAVSLLTTAIGINAATYLGFQINHIDLSPNHSGTMMGITNMAANICSLIAPLVVGFVLTDAKNVGQWQIVFFIAAGVYFLGNLQFLIFGRAHVQIWNEPMPKKRSSPSRNSDSDTP